MRARFRGVVAGLGLALLVSSAWADDFPQELVRWVPADPTPVFFGAGGDAWDRQIRERGWILYEDGVYHLWYTGYNDSKSKRKALGYATSKDGVNWVRSPSNPLYDLRWVEDMCVVKHDGKYVMFAEGEGDIAHKLTSSDRIHWTDEGDLDIRKVDGTPIAPGPRGTPFVWVEAGTWYLFYERGDRGVWLATSTDGKLWKNVQDDPVIAMGPEAYDREAVAVNQIIRRDGWYYAIYHANAHRPWADWTTCVARSRDLVHWEKYPGNPIVGANCSSGIWVDTPEGLRLYTMHPQIRRFRPANAVRPAAAAAN